MVADGTEILTLPWPQLASPWAQRHPLDVVVGVRRGRTLLETGILEYISQFMVERWLYLAEVFVKLLERLRLVWFMAKTGCSVRPS